MYVSSSLRFMLASLHSFLTTSPSEEFEDTKRIMSVNRRRTDKTMTKKRTKGQTMAYKILSRILKTGQDEPTKNSVELHRILLLGLVYFNLIN
jgi:hypothetical protein